MKHSESKKAHLFTRILPELSASALYFSLESVRVRMSETGIATADASLQSYMSEAMKTGIVHDAGRGWYSGIAAPFTLDSKPIRTLISRIEKKFPLMDFSCWSTEQLNPYMEHLLAKFVAFVYADRDLLPALYDEIQSWKSYRVYLDPKMADARKFRVDENTIVIRPPTSESPSQSEPHAASIEQVLVDLAVELKTLPVMSRGEFQNMAWRVANAGRITISTLLRYARRNHQEPAMVFGEKWSSNGTSDRIVPLLD